ncbi:MAG TPA: ATP-binding protein [Pyrinomonadaceae bacterium]|nr:ATP-binding protein [Pyrinomonadaceae bacterium]
MARNWTESRLQNFITSEIEESLTLEYKSAEALDRNETKKKEITKDVSAMANSAGGIIVYGIAEYNDAEKRHLPERITPVDRRKYPREWVEQIIQAIRPRIDGIVIHSVNLSSGESDVAFVIEIPQSNTAHQANDHRYYKRFNFQAVPMEDYEIRDVMFREQTPNIVLNFLIEITHFITEEGNKINYNLIVQAQNNGSAFAQYVAVFLDAPVLILQTIENKLNVKDGGRFYRHRLTNLNQEYADEQFKSNFPLLRNMSMNWRIPLKENFDEFRVQDLALKWKIYADNALPKEGKISLKEIEVVDLRKTRFQT